MKPFKQIPTLRRLACLLVATISLNGCSLLFVDGPPRDEQRGLRRDYSEPVSCTTSYAAPVVDAVLAALYLTATVYTATRPEEQLQAKDTSAGEVIASGLLTTALFGTSGVIGAGRVSDCRDARAPMSSRHVSRAELAPKQMMWTSNGVKEEP